MQNNPLSPHIQIYKWHISSLVSITTRITGIINTIVISLLCLWISSLLLGEETYKSVNYFLSSFIGKFFVMGIIWSFSFQMLSEIRHIIMDLGYGFDLKIAKITGVLALIGSFILTILFYIVGRNLF